MGYTTSIRQWNYIIDWCERFIETETPYNYFFTEDENPGRTEEQINADEEETKKKA